MVLGQLPSLRSSTGESLLSGQQCPGILTLTCNAMNFGTSGLIGWYAGNLRLARFDIISDSLPYSVALTSPLKATVQISSVSQSNSYFNFINFTLSAPVSNFITIRGLAVTCGTLGVRSEEFRIFNYTVFGNRYQESKYCLINYTHYL